MDCVRAWVAGIWSTAAAGLLPTFRRPLRFLAFTVGLPLTLVILATHQVNLVIGHRQALHNLHVTAELAAGLVEEMLTEAQLLERMLAEQPGFTAANAPQTLAAQLAVIPALLPDADVAEFIRLDGRVLASAPGGKYTGRDVSFHSAFIGARATGWQPYVSAVYLREPVQAEKVVGISVPVMREGEVEGLLQVQYRVDAIRARLQRIRVEPEGFVYVVDQEQQLVSYPFQVLPGRPKIAAAWPPVAAAIGERGETLEYQDSRTGARWLAGMYPVRATGWRVVATQPVSAVDASIHRVLWPMGVLAAALLGLVAMLGLQWAHLHAASLRLLQQNTTLLKQLQQQRTLSKGAPPGPPPAGPPGGQP